MPRFCRHRAFFEVPICEGPDDIAFLRALNKHHRIGQFNIESTATPPVDNKGGKSKYYKKLLSIDASSTKAKPNKILFVGDNDENPQRSFRDICAQIRKWLPDSVPEEPLTPCGENPSITVMMLPIDGGLGCLETMCLDAARSFNAQIANNVDLFCATIRCEAWASENRKSKTWLRTMLAASCEKDPFIYLKNVFSYQSNHRLIPLDHHSFEPIVLALRRFVEGR